MKVPKSSIYAPLALQDYLRRRENKNLFPQIKAAQRREWRHQRKTCGINLNECIGGSWRANGKVKFGLVRN
jgi:hypothetical protein